MQQFHIDTNLIEYIRGIDIINIVIKNKISKLILKYCLKFIFTYIDNIGK
jgi:hypothetical protein